MRLFFAVNFNKEVKDRFAAVQNDLKKRALKGNFTLYENLHLTLAFVGEVSENRAGQLRLIAERLRFEPFDLRFDHIGRFKRGNGDLIWSGAKKGAPLSSLYDKLSSQIRSAGFPVDSRPYTPHLTLARGVKFREGFSLTDYSKAFDPVCAHITSASLMKSERINGRLTYTELSGGAG